MDYSEQDQIKKVTSKILESGKYRSFYPATIEKVVGECLNRYPIKDLEKMVRKKLHQMWGAYLNRPNYNKALAKLDNSELRSLLYLQSSTSEREPFLKEFYDKIFAATENPERVVEYGCGINALTVRFMPGLKEYTGFDLDREMIDFINEVYLRTGISDLARARVGDILIDQPIDADLTMMLKLAPLLERQEKGSTRRVLKKIPSKFIALSYPTKSISGREKGMEHNYRESFKETVQEESWGITEILFENELLFIIKK